MLLSDMSNNHQNNNLQGYQGSNQRSSLSFQSSQSQGYYYETFQYQRVQVFQQSSSGNGQQVQQLQIQQVNIQYQQHHHRDHQGQH